MFDKFFDSLNVTNYTEGMCNSLKVFPVALPFLQWLPIEGTCINYHNIERTKNILFSQWWFSAVDSKWISSKLWKVGKGMCRVNLFSWKEKEDDAQPWNFLRTRYSMNLLTNELTKSLPIPAMSFLKLVPCLFSLLWSDINSESETTPRSYREVLLLPAPKGWDKWNPTVAEVYKNTQVVRV